MSITTQHCLRPAPPFDFTKSLTFIGEFLPTSGEQDVHQQALTKAVRVAGQTVVFAVGSSGTADQPELSCDLHAEMLLPPAVEQAVLDRVRFFLSLDDDLRPFYALAELDPPFQRVMKALYGYHQVKFLTPFENACWAVLTQRTPGAVARSFKRRLTESYGGSVKIPGGTLWAFPEPADLKSVSTGELGKVLGNTRKGEYLTAIVQTFLGVDESWLRTAPYSDVKRWLLDIHGIGEWSAMFVLVRGLGRMEGALIDDPNSLFTKEMLMAGSKVYGSLDHAELLAIATRYGRWRGYWGHYLRVAS